MDRSGQCLPGRPGRGRVGPSDHTAVATTFRQERWPCPCLPRKETCPMQSPAELPAGPPGRSTPSKRVLGLAWPSKPCPGSGAGADASSLQALLGKQGQNVLTGLGTRPWSTKPRTGPGGASSRGTPLSRWRRSVPSCAGSVVSLETARAKLKPPHSFRQVLGSEVLCGVWASNPTPPHTHTRSHAGSCTRKCGCLGQVWGQRAEGGCGGGGVPVCLALRRFLWSVTHGP